MHWIQCFVISGRSLFSLLSIQYRGWQTSSIKGQSVSILSVVSPGVSIATTRLCHWSMKPAIDNIYVNKWHGGVSTKLFMNIEIWITYYSHMSWKNSFYFYNHWKVFKNKFLAGRLHRYRWWTRFGLTATDVGILKGSLDTSQGNLIRGKIGLSPVSGLWNFKTVPNVPVCSGWIYDPLNFLPPPSVCLASVLYPAQPPMKYSPFTEQLRKVPTHTSLLE